MASKNCVLSLPAQRVRVVRDLSEKALPMLGRSATRFWAIKANGDGKPSIPIRLGIHNGLRLTVRASKRSSVWAEPQRGLEMAYRQFGLPGPSPEPTTPIP